MFWAVTAVGAILRQAEGMTGRPFPISPWVFVMIQTAQAIVIARSSTACSPSARSSGRAYLRPKLTPLGGRRAFLLMGLIWGVWHWLVIAMGHNYGLDYPGAPWLGMLAMVWFTFLIGTFPGLGNAA